MTTILETRKYIRQERAWQAKYDPAAPKNGDPAPNFELRDVTGRDSIRLSDFKGKKPVALVFGSYT